MLEVGANLEFKFPARIEIISNVFDSKPYTLNIKELWISLDWILKLLYIKTKFSNIQLSIKVLEALCLARLNIWTCSKFRMD